MVRECTKGNTAVNRNVFRGVTAMLIAGALATGGTVVGSAMASPATPDDVTVAQVGTPLGLSHNDKLVPQHPVRPKARAVRSRPRVASRAHLRRALTGSPQTIAHALLLRRGWSETQWACLDTLWNRESGWSTYAQNRSGAYGIPQSLPASKMAMMGSDWRTNPITQIRWGLWYIGATYGSPCNALAHSNAYGYY